MPSQPNIVGHLQPLGLVARKELLTPTVAALPASKAEMVGAAEETATATVMGKVATATGPDADIENPPASPLPARKPGQSRVIVTARSVFHLINQRHIGAH